MNPIEFTTRDEKYDPIFACGRCGVVYTSIPHSYPAIASRKGKSARDRAEACCTCYVCGKLPEEDDKSRRKGDLPRPGLHYECETCKLLRFGKIDAARRQKVLAETETVIPLADYKGAFLALWGGDEYFENDDAVGEWFWELLEETAGEADEPLLIGCKPQEVKVNFLHSIERVREDQHEDFDFSMEAHQAAYEFEDAWNKKFAETVWIDDPKTRVDCSDLWAEVKAEWQGEKQGVACELR